MKRSCARCSDNFFHGRTDIAPLRGALSVWNLDIDDLGAASFPGTGTTANDKNESEVTHKQMAHLGRSLGNPLPVICQKNLTGHPKGAAAAWMLNGLLQVLNSGLIPGNRRCARHRASTTTWCARTVASRPWASDEEFRVWPGRRRGAGGAPGCHLSTLPAEEFQHYSARREQRLIKMNKHTQSVNTGKHLQIRVKNEVPYSSVQESNVYLSLPDGSCPVRHYVQDVAFWSLTAINNRRLRVEKRAKKAKAAAAVAPTKKTTETHSVDSSSTLLTAINQAATDLGLASKKMSMGVDVEPVATFENLNGREDFIRRNFTD